MSQLAYLVIREGAKWSDVFRLIPGQAVTVGRAPTNQIVLKDERCSRNHLEVFVSGGQWMLRDLDSRNGTLVGTQRVMGDWALQPGDIIRIGRSQLVFVHRLAEAFADSTSVMRPLPDKEGTVAVAEEEDANVLAGPTTITHRRGQTRFLEPGEGRRQRGLEDRPRRRSSSAGWLLNWPRPPIRPPWPIWRCDGLAEGTQTDAGAVLLLPNDFRGTPRAESPRSGGLAKLHRAHLTIRSPPCWPPP